MSESVERLERVPADVEVTHDSVDGEHAYCPNGTETRSFRGPQNPVECVRPVVAFGPALDGFGSWEWIGAETAAALRDRFDTVTFHEQVPDADVVVFVKFRPSDALLRDVARRSAVVLCPVDGYAGAADIDVDGPALSHADRIVVHCHRLRKYFASYALTEYVDHPLRFTAPPPSRPRASGPIVWAGVRTNLPPLVEWVNRNRLPEELWVLTNPERDDVSLRPSDFGFRSHNRVRVERWTPERQREWTGLARAALDVKGADFRSRHKPSVKAFDFIASGVPFATNRDGSPADHLRGLGFDPAAPEDPDRWLSRDYFVETAQLGQVLREHLGRKRVADAWARLIDDVIRRRAAVGAERMTRAVGFRRPLASDHEPAPSIPVPHSNRAVETTSDEVASGEAASADVVSDAARAPSEGNSVCSIVPPITASISTADPNRAPRIAFLSLLFNWPSTGGGTIHTYEAAKFLRRAGCDVLHVYARHDGWGLGRVTQPLAVPARELWFDDATWHADEIRRRFRDVLDAFAPDAVIVTDSWNTKPLLAEAAAGYRVFLRLAALECLCPLNNVRLLLDRNGQPLACPRQQLAEPTTCRSCVRRNGALSGSLHQAERGLAGFEESDYERRLLDSFAKADGVLVVNSAIADLVRPYAKAVHVVPSGFDPARFDLAALDANPPPKPAGKLTLLFAGLTHEYMKGFPILLAACDRLRAVRDDFELVVTAESFEPGRDYLRCVGWQSQDDLPRHIRAADLLVFPTLAEEALGRSAVEAMGCGRPVVASRIGGLPFTVVDGETGLLFVPGDANDLAEKLARLLDDADLRQRLGDAGRKRFEVDFTWDSILDRHYRPLLGLPKAASTTA